MEDCQGAVEVGVDANQGLDVVVTVDLLWDLQDLAVVSHGVVAADLALLLDSRNALERPDLW